MVTILLMFTLVKIGLLDLIKPGDFDLNDKGRSGRPIEVNDAVLEELLEEDLRQLTRDLVIFN